MKIAIYSGTAPSTTFIERLIKGIANKGVTVYIFGIQNQNLNYNKNCKLITYSNNVSKLLLILKYSLLLSLFKSKEKKKLDSLYSKKTGSKINWKAKCYPVLYHKPDIFHLQWVKGIAEWMWVKEFGCKIVVSLRGTHITISPLADSTLATNYRSNFPNVDGFHAVSKAIKNEALLYNADATKMDVVYSGLQLSDFPFKNGSTSSSKVMLLSVGRSHWLKGYRYGLQAASLLKKRGIAFQYDIIGVDQEEELLFLRHQLNLEQEVFFHPYMSFDAINLKMQNAAIFLLPSVTEGIANVALEAMALGTIVLSSDCGGMTEVIQDGINGFVTKSRDAAAMAQKVETIIALSDNEKAIIRDNARATICNRFSEYQMVKGILELYNKVLNQ